MGGRLGGQAGEWVGEGGVDTWVLTDIACKLQAGGQAGRQAGRGAGRQAGKRVGRQAGCCQDVTRLCTAASGLHVSWHCGAASSVSRGHCSLQDRPITKMIGCDQQDCYDQQGLPHGAARGLL